MRQEREFLVLRMILLGREIVTTLLVLQTVISLFLFCFDYYAPTVRYCLRGQVKNHSYLNTEFCLPN